MVKTYQKKVFYRKRSEKILLSCTRKFSLVPHDIHLTAVSWKHLLTVNIIYLMAPLTFLLQTEFPLNNQLNLLYCLSKKSWHILYSKLLFYPLYIVSYYMKWVKTSWTYSIVSLHAAPKNFFDDKKIHELTLKIRNLRFILPNSQWTAQFV